LYICKEAHTGSMGIQYILKNQDNIKKYLELQDKELLAATLDELNKHVSLLGSECSYMKNVNHTASTV